MLQMIRRLGDPIVGSLERTYDKLKETYHFLRQFGGMHYA
jgi:hypothetical protein